MFYFTAEAQFPEELWLVSSRTKLREINVTAAEGVHCGLEAVSGPHAVSLLTLSAYRRNSTLTCSPPYTRNYPYIIPGRLTK